MTKAELQQQKDERRRQKKRIKRQRLVFFCVCLAILGIASVGMLSSRSIASSQEDLIADLTRQIQEVHLHNGDLQLQLEYMQTEDYIRSVARNQLGLVRPGEIRFVEKPK